MHKGHWVILNMLLGFDNVHTVKSSTRLDLPLQFGAIWGWSSDPRSIEREKDRVTECYRGSCYLSNCIAARCCKWPHHHARSSLGWKEKTAKTSKAGEIWRWRRWLIHAGRLSTTFNLSSPLSESFKLVAVSCRDPSGIHLNPLESLSNALVFSIQMPKSCRFFQGAEGEAPVALLAAQLLRCRQVCWSDVSRQSAGDEKQSTACLIALNAASVVKASWYMTRIQDKVAPSIHATWNKCQDFYACACCSPGEIRLQWPLWSGFEMVWMYSKVDLVLSVPRWSGMSYEAASVRLSCLHIPALSRRARKGLGISWNLTESDYTILY